MHNGGFLAAVLLSVAVFAAPGAGAQVGRQSLHEAFAVTPQTQYSKLGLLIQKFLEERFKEFPDIAGVGTEMTRQLTHPQLIQPLSPQFCHTSIVLDYGNGGRDGQPLERPATEPCEGA